MAPQRKAILAAQIVMQEGHISEHTQSMCKSFRLDLPLILILSSTHNTHDDVNIKENNSLKPNSQVAKKVTGPLP